MDVTAHEKTRIRVLRKKQVADTVRDVLKDKSDLPDTETSLHRVVSQYQKSAFAEREVFEQLLQCTMILLRHSKKQDAEIETLRNRIYVLESLKV